MIYHIFVEEPGGLHGARKGRSGIGRRMGCLNATLVRLYTWGSAWDGDEPPLFTSLLAPEQAISKNVVAVNEFTVSFPLHVSYLIRSNYLCSSGETISVRCGESPVVACFAFFFSVMIHGACFKEGTPAIHPISFFGLNVRFI